MIKLPYDEFVMIYDHHNIFFLENMVIDAFLLAYLNCSLCNIFVYGSLICIYLINILVNWLIV